MKLSMWMIANRLKDHNCIYEVEENAPVVLRGARRANTANCLYVYQEGGDSVYQGVGGKITLPATPLGQAFELAQSIFDLYDDWDDALRGVMDKGGINFQKAVDISRNIFRNPLIVSDASYKVLGLSKQYGPDDVDEEWRTLCQEGFHSSAALNLLAKEPSLDLSVRNAQYMRARRPMMLFDCITTPLYSGETYCGRFNILEKDTKLNSGYLQLADHFAFVIAGMLEKITDESRNPEKQAFFSALLSKRAIAQNEFDRQLEYLGWQKNDSFRVITLGMIADPQSIRKELLGHIRSIALHKINFCAALIYENSLVIILNERHISLDTLTKTLTSMIEGSAIKYGVSLLFADITNAAYYYKQAVSAVHLASISGSSAQCCSFYDYAADSLMLSAMTEETQYSCHPDIAMLGETDKKTGTGYYKTLMTYLSNECNVIESAKLLFIHRNTLVYRLGKISGLLKHSLDDAYTREYMLISFRVLRLLKLIGLTK